MAEIEIAGESIVVRLRGWEVVWAWRRRIAIPRANVRDARLDPANARRRPRGLRTPGSYVPRVLTAGTYRGRGYKEFWSVRHPERAITLDLTGSPFNQIIVDVDDPLEVIRTIESAIV
jgi:hypothetical protein